MARPCPSRPHVPSTRGACARRRASRVLASAPMRASDEGVRPRRAVRAPCVAPWCGSMATRGRRRGHKGHTPIAHIRAASIQHPQPVQHARGSTMCISPSPPRRYRHHAGRGATVRLLGGVGEHTPCPHGVCAYAVSVAWSGSPRHARTPQQTAALPRNEHPTPRLPCYLHGWPSVVFALQARRLPTQSRSATAHRVAARAWRIVASSPR